MTPSREMIEAVMQGVTPAELVDVVIEAKQKLTGFVKKALSGKEFSTTKDYDTPDKARRAVTAGFFRMLGKQGKGGK